MPQFWTFGDVSPLGFKVRVDRLNRAQWRRTRYTLSQIHLWCNTCRPLESKT